MITACRQAGHFSCQAKLPTRPILPKNSSGHQLQVESFYTTQRPLLVIHQNLKRAALEVSAASFRTCLLQNLTRAPKPAFACAESYLSASALRNIPPVTIGRHTNQTVAMATSADVTPDVTMALASGADVASDVSATKEPSGDPANAPVAEVHVVLDRSKYVKHVRVQALRVPKGACHQLVKKLNKFKAEYPKVRNVVVEESRPETRLILLGENVSGPELVGLPEDLAAELKADPGVEITEHDIVLDYDSYTAEQVLREILPPGAEVPSSFETIGHVAHVNLRDELLPYKKIIGEVLLEKNFPRIRTILNKVGTIENEFRVPTFEVLAGDPSTVTEVKQHTARFQLDYARVYWNSRLEFEHCRLVEQFARDDVICDMFAGIGPFAIPAALKGCAVYANDLNPQSTHYLAINAKLNKVPHRVRVSTLDAREFVRSLVRPAEGQSPATPPAEPYATSSRAANDHTGQRTVRDGAGGAGPSIAQLEEQAFGGGENGAETNPMLRRAPSGGEPSSGNGNGVASTGARSLVVAGGSGGSQNEPPKAGVEAPKGKPPMVRPPKEAVPERPLRIDHVVMNLPASGIDFLDVFNGLFDRATWHSPLPRIHCYCFARAFETDADVIKRAEEALGGAIPDPIVWNVRDVAPNKTMLCVSFSLPDNVGYKQPPAASGGAHTADHERGESASRELSNHAKKSRVDQRCCNSADL